MSNLPDQLGLTAPLEEPKNDPLEASHIDRVSSFVRSHRNSVSQGRAWISTSSILPFKEKQHSRNDSNSSFSSNIPGEKVLLESPEKITEIAISELQREDAPSQTPEEFGKLLFRGEGGIPQNEIIPLLGKK